MKQNNCIEMRLFILILIIGSTCATAFGRQVDFFVSTADSTEIVQNTTIEHQADNTATAGSQFKPKFKRLKAALLALFLGHFGVHRIYLGTSPNVPIVYSLTLGGGLGLLPLADFIFILTAKDLDAFTDNDKVFMWLK
jgi:TM2 domain-containing membrane protein YozV